MLANIVGKINASVVIFVKSSEWAFISFKAISLINYAGIALAASWYIIIAGKGLKLSPDSLIFWIRPYLLSPDNNLDIELLLPM